MTQVVFSPSPIDVNTPDAGVLTTEFFADEKIYARAYLAQSVVNHPVYGADVPNERVANRARYYFYRFFVDGKEEKWDETKRQLSSDADLAATTFAPWIYPDRSIRGTPTAWNQILREMTPGKHTVRLEMWTGFAIAPAREPLAAGEFVVEKLEETVGPVGKNFGDFEVGMRNPKLTRKLLAVAQDFAKAKGWKEQLTDLKIEDEAWFVVRHEYTKQPISRTIRVWLRAVKADGECTAQGMRFEQEMVGEVPTGPIRHRSTGHQDRIDCPKQRLEKLPPPETPSERWAARERKKPTPTHAPAPSAPTPTHAPAPSVPTPSVPVSPAPLPSVPAPVAVAPTPSEPPAPALSEATTRVAVAQPVTQELSTKRASNNRPIESAPGRWSLAVGGASNLLDVSGLSSYVSASVRLGPIDVGIGGTWPLNALVSLRAPLGSGRLRVSPMLAAVFLGESESPESDVAMAGGISLAYAIITGALSLGIRLDALVSYNVDPSEIAVPVLGSTYIRF